MVFLKPPNPCLVTVQAPKLADAPSPAVEAILRVAPPPQRRISGMTAWAKSAGDLAFSAKRSPEVCYYPDSGKYGRTSANGMKTRSSPRARARSTTGSTRRSSRPRPSLRRAVIEPLPDSRGLQPLRNRRPRIALCHIGHNQGKSFFRRAAEDIKTVAISRSRPGSPGTIPPAPLDFTTDGYRRAHFAGGRSDTIYSIYL